MDKHWRSFRILCALAAALMSMGCSSSDGDDSGSDGDSGGGSATNAPINISGGFVGQRSNTNGSAAVNFDFDQVGEALTGSLTDSSLGVGNITGSIVSNRVEFTTIFSAGDLIVAWNGVANPSGTALQGTWIITLGGSASGEWTAAR